MFIRYYGKSFFNTFISHSDLSKQEEVRKLTVVKLVVDETEEITLAFMDMGVCIRWFFSISFTLLLSVLTLVVDPLMKAVIPRPVDV